MHPDTLAAVRLLVLALQAHPEDLQPLATYGGLPRHLADLAEDWLETDAEGDE